MTTQEILAELGRLLIPGRMTPGYAPALIGDLWLYVLLFLAVIVLFMQPEGSLNVTLLMAAVILAIFVDKVHAFEIMQGGKHICSLGTLLIRILMLVIPLISAGITQNPKARAPAVVMGLLGGAYMFLFWFFEMNNPNVCPPLLRDF